MLKSLKSVGVAAGFATALAMGASAQAADAPTKMSVIGTWNSMTNYNDREAPFWRGIAKKTKGGVIATIGSYSEFGLKGFEVMRMLKSGVFDYAYGLPGYVAAENAVFEGGDLSSVTQDIVTQRKVAEASFPTLEKAFAKYYNAKLLQLYPFPSQILYCKNPISGIADLKGKKIRVYATSLGDFVEGVGGTSVTVSFGEVIPALEKGVVDCAITGTMSAYTAKWYQAAKYVYSMRVGWGLAFGAMNMDKWNSMSETQQTDMKARLDTLTDEMWAATAKEDDVAIACLTSNECPIGKDAPLGGMTLVEPTEADLAARDKVANDVVLARWAERCGKECADNWNATVGKVLNMKAVAK
ncbi:TRAP transporter substrate-binding protein [Sneathiella sp.]|jgi:TRAP-type C4-dicarboxylate transport system substrate-binding protein|uniref:TRAP transporter substrate-binding protein n=1 Tax=Sneathiella sp. TaxID=1964365 RepID=UPI0039E32AAC